MSDELLEWMSYRGQGRIDELPSANVGAAQRRAIDNLSVLGHAEMPNPLTWRIAAPCLAELPSGPNARRAAVLCDPGPPVVVPVGALHLVRGGGRAPEEAVGEAHACPRLT